MGLRSAGLAILTLLALPTPGLAQYHPGDPTELAGWQWNILDVRASTVRSAEIDASKVTVAILDTGVDFAHPDLAPVRWLNPDELPDNGIDDDLNGYVDDLHGWDWCTGQPAGDYRGGHGTHVAGVVAALPHDANAVFGVAPGAKIMDLRVLCDGTSAAPDRNALPDFDALTQAIRYARMEGARVASMSIFWSPSEFHSVLRTLTVLEDEFRRAQEAGVFLVAAAGNTGGPVSFPANEPHVFAVGALDLGNRIPAYSARGPDVDLWAPGGAGPKSSCTESDRGRILSTWEDQAYHWCSGTSMAAPHVSGAAALLVAQNPDLTSNDLAAHLASTAYVLPTGERVLDVAAALAIPYEPPRASLVWPRDGDTVPTRFAPQVAYTKRHEVYSVDFLIDDVESYYALTHHEGPLEVQVRDGTKQIRFGVAVHDGRESHPQQTIRLKIDPALKPQDSERPVLYAVPEGEPLEEAVRQLELASADTPSPGLLLSIAGLLAGLAVAPRRRT